MNVLLVLLGFGVLLAVAWPLVLLVLLLWPVLWLLSIPFRIVGAALDAVIALVRSLLFLPARLLGYRGA